MMNYFRLLILFLSVMILPVGVSFASGELATPATNSPKAEGSLRLSEGSGAIDIPLVDAERLRAAWLSWHNEERAKKELPLLSYHNALEITATERSTEQLSKYKGHRREGIKGSYDYNGIKDRFAQRAVNFTPITGGRNLFSESIGYRSYQCSSGDCTDQIIAATKRTFDTFLKEGERGVHYRAIVMPHFTQMGIGVAVNPTTKTVYTTIHYSVDLIY